MTDAQELTQPAEPLLAFSQATGITSETWAAREELERLTYADPEFSREIAAGLTLDEFTPLIDAYGDALTCRFRLGDLTVLDVANGLDELALEHFRGQTQQSPTVELDFVLDKARLIEHWFDDAPNCRPFLYLFPEALARFLTSDLPRLERRLWGSETAGKVVLLVPARDIWLDGPHLAVLGGDRIDAWREVVAQAPPNAERLRTMYETCRDNLRWQEPWLDHLTPLHLDVEGHAAPGDLIANALRVHLTNAVVLYTADRTVTRSGQWVATYAGAQQSVELTLAEPADKLEEGAGVRSLVELLEWTYHPQWAADRLPFVQIGIAQALHAAPPDVRYRLLLLNAAGILDGLKWEWKAFVEKKIDAYTAQVRELEKDVAGTVQAVANQVAEMIKSLSETMLAAVGALLGSFIAALFKDQFNPTIFAAGMVAYAVYVLVFPLGYNMLNQWGRYQVLAENFRQRRRRFEGLLYQERVGEIVGTQVTDSQRQYQRWFWATVLAYVVVIILAVVAAAVVPGVMAGSGAVPTPTPAP